MIDKLYNSPMDCALTGKTCTFWVRNKVQIYRNFRYSKNRFTCQGSGFFVSQRKAMSPVSGDVQGAGDDAVGDAAQDQLGQDADAQAVLHHGHDGVVIPRR